MGGNYPDGVSGNEYEISGPDYEAIEERECGEEDVTLRVMTVESKKRLDDLKELLRSVDPKETIDPIVLSKIRFGMETVYVDVADLKVCTFEGEVDVQGFQSSCWWTCPVCFTEHHGDRA